MSLDFIAGCLGGCAGVLVGHPLDTVKVHLQTQDAANLKYRGTWHCFLTLLRNEKLRGLYRGMASPMAGVGIVNAIVFGIYGNVQRNTGDPNSLLTHCYAGSAAGLVQSLVCSPIELAKTRMQLQSESLSSTGPKYKGSFDCLRQVLRAERLKGIFKGLGITALRDVPGFAAYFVAYEYLMRFPSSPNSFHAFIAGGFAGMISWVVCYPQDVIKTCLQAEGYVANPKYNGIIDCAIKGYKSDGLHFFFRGFTPTMIRSFPTNAACFFVVSLFMRLTHSKKKGVVHTGDTLNGANLSILSYCHLYNQQKEDNMLYQLQPGFHEAICQREVKELVNEHKKDNCVGKYFIYEDSQPLVDDVNRHYYQ